MQVVVVVVVATEAAADAVVNRSEPLTASRARPAARSQRNPYTPQYDFRRANGCYGVAACRLGLFFVLDRGRAAGRRGPTLSPSSGSISDRHADVVYAPCRRHRRTLPDQQLEQFQGWDNQFKNEFGAQLVFERKYRNEFCRIRTAARLLALT